MKSGIGYWEEVTAYTIEFGFDAAMLYSLWGKIQGLGYHIFLLVAVCTAGISLHEVVHSIFASLLRDERERPD